MLWLQNTLKVLQAMLSQMLLADVFYNYDVNLQIKHLKNIFLPLIAVTHPQ